MAIHKIHNKNGRFAFSECGKALHLTGGEVSYQWGGVTCKNCLKIHKIATKQKQIKEHLKNNKIKCNSCLKEKEEYVSGICKECADKMDKHIEAKKKETSKLDEMLSKMNDTELLLMYHISLKALLKKGINPLVEK